MKFITLSEQQIKTSKIYNSIKEKHVVISVTSSDSEGIIIPANASRVSQLFLKFDDVQDIDLRFVYFDRSMAEEIFRFIESNISSISLIVVQCQAGVSRSVAIASALSKIINYADDAIYTKGLPNMFVYITLLDYFFGNRFWRKEYPKIAFRRNQAMSYYLQPTLIRLSNTIDSKREKDV